MTAIYYVGDVLDVLGKLPENSVDLVLSSPPFWSLRSYLPQDHPDKAFEIGSEPTPGEYVDKLIDVVEALDRVLAPHGSMVLELADTYAGSGGAGGDYDPGGWREGQETFEGSGKKHIDAKYERIQYGGHEGSLRNLHGKQQRGGHALPKSLSLIPESFRFAMVYGFNPFTGRQTERWRLRNVIRWVRPNPPVGALGDKFRPATSELMVFCKSAKRFFDLDAVREPAKGGEIDTARRAHAVGADGFGQPPRWTGTTATEEGHRINSNPAGAPPLDWWNIPPGGYSGSHYAVWPAALLIEPIKSMCPEQVCRTCGEARRRIVGEAEYLPSASFRGGHTDLSESNRVLDGEGHINQFKVDGQGRASVVRNAPTVGFTDCGHDDYRPGLVLDPFAGSGTTLTVASGHGRDSIGIDLDERNFALALERVGPLVLQRGEVAA